MEDRLRLLVLRVCVENFRRAPEECADVHWETLWELAALGEQVADSR